MSEILKSLEDLKNVCFDEEAGLVIDKDRSTFRNRTKEIALTISFLLGISEESINKRIETPEEYLKIKEVLEKDQDAVAIRHLNNVRSNLMLDFKNVSRSLRNITVDYKPLDKLELFEEDFKILKTLGVTNIIGGYDVNEYIRRVNNEILKRVDKLERFFPEWVKFKNIKSLFIMPNNIEEESKKFQSNQSTYPFQRYLFWSDPMERGYILASDSDILSVAYHNCGEIFLDYSKVTDASDATKRGISEFIELGNKVQIFVDGENVDPYMFASAITGLADYEIQKINKIVVYYDNRFSTKAWLYLKHFVCEIEVETIGVERISENKSLVDHKLVAGVSKAVYKENADRIILASSDSDFWSVIDSIEDAKFMVMIEQEKSGFDFKSLLRENDVFYCYMDKFKTIDDNRFFKMVFRKELQEVIEEKINLCNAKEIYSEALMRSRAGISDAESESIFDKYVKGIKLVISSDGTFELHVPE